MKEYKFISPLTGWISSDYDESIVDNTELLYRIDMIKEACEKSIDEERGLAEYIDEDYPEAKDKVKDIRITVEEINGKLMGVAIVTSDELTNNGIEEVKKYLSGQYSDGWGEGFEQNEIDSWIEEEQFEEYDEEEGEYYMADAMVQYCLYCSFWSYDKEWSIELYDGSTDANADTRPVAKMIGQDGNVFNLIGIASRALKKAGKIDEDKEMMSRITKAGSYSEALTILTDYVRII